MRTAVGRHPQGVERGGNRTGGGGRTAFVQLAYREAAWSRGWGVAAPTPAAAKPAAMRQSARAGRLKLYWV